MDLSEFGRGNQINVDRNYAKLLESELLKIFPPGTSQGQIAATINIGKNTYHSLFRNNRASIRILDQISDFCHVVRYTHYVRNLKVVNAIRDRLVSDGGKWISFRFDSRRRLYESIWEFYLNDDQRLLNTDLKPTRFIEAKKFTH